MLSYFLGNTRNLAKRLGDAQIPFEPFQIEGQRGFVFDESHLARVLAALNATVESKEKSSYEGVHILCLNRNRRSAATASVAPATVRVEEWSRESDPDTEADFVRVAGEFATSFGVREIVLVDVRDTAHPTAPRSGTGNLNIFIWSSASGLPLRTSEGGIECAAWLWGYKIAEAKGEWRIWPASGQGVVIKDPAGTNVAELVGENLYIFYPITSDQMQNREGVFRKLLKEACLLRGLSPEEVEKRRQRAERQRDKELRAEARANPVVVERWEASSGLRDKFVAVARDFTRALGNKPIIVHDYCGNVQRHPPSTDGRVHICIWSSSDDLDSDGDMQKTLFGERLTWREHEAVIKPSGTWGTLITDEDGNQVGKVMGDTIYIHYPLTKRRAELMWGGKGPEELFRRILEEVVFEKTATEEERAARARVLAEKHRARHREEYVKACNGRSRVILDEARETIEAAPSRVREYQQAIIKLIRESKDAQRRIIHLEEHQAEAAVAYAKEFDSLVKIPKIRDVRVDDGVIKVFTDILYCVDPRSKKRHEIGAFRIHLGLNGTVRWHNLTRRVDGFGRDMHAPHVSSNGEACLGNMSEVVPQLIADYEFAVLAMLAIQFIESVNVDDVSGSRIDRWPVAA